MGKLKKGNYFFVFCITILSVIVLIIGYYGIFIYPQKQTERQRLIIDAIEQEVKLSLPNSLLLHSGSEMELFINHVGWEFCHINIIGSFDKKEYDKLLSDLMVWEISGGYLSQEDILKIEPDFHKNWKALQSNGNSQYDFFVRQIEVYGHGKKPYYSYVHNQAVMIIEDKERDVYKLHLSVAIDVPEYFKQDIKIYYELGRPAEKSELFYHPSRY